MTKIINFAMKIKGGGREGGTCEVLRPCHPLKIWNMHMVCLERAITSKGRIFSSTLSKAGNFFTSLWSAKLFFNRLRGENYFCKNSITPPPPPPENQMVRLMPRKNISQTTGIVK